MQGFEALTVQPVGLVQGGRTAPTDDHWGDVEAVIALDPARFAEEALMGLATFSHLEVIYRFHLVAEDAVQMGARHPRERSDWPKVGIFAQRGRVRPNRLGVSLCRLLRVEGLKVFVQGLDAIDGTPVLDIKPWMQAFGPRGDVREPDWVKEIMREYW